MNILNQKDLITELLNNYPELKDDDNKLIAKVWNLELEINIDNPELVTAVQFIELLSDGAFANAESIRRCRAKLQEELPHLRGDKYIKRHRHQADVINQLNQF